MRPVTPRGFRDVLFQEAAERDALAAALRDVFAAWGYAPVETPVVEESAVLEAGVGAARRHRVPPRRPRRPPARAAPGDDGADRAPRRLAACATSPARCALATRPTSSASTRRCAARRASSRRRASSSSARGGPAADAEVVVAARRGAAREPGSRDFTSSPSAPSRSSRDLLRGRGRAARLGAPR